MADIAGNTYDTALAITVGTTAKTFKDAVSPLDTNDYYRFSVSGRRSFNLALSGLTADANVELQREDGTVLQNSTQLGIANEGIYRTIDPGTYFIRVYPTAGATTNYSFRVSAFPDLAGETLATARSVAINSSPILFQDYVGTSDSADVYRIDLNKRGVLNLKLDGLAANANVQLLNSAGSILQSSLKPGTTAEVLDRAVDAGTYYVRVFPATTQASTSYNLTLSHIPDIVSYQSQGLNPWPSTLLEASGLIRGSGDYWWSHNDSGNSPTLYAVNDSGSMLNQVTISGATNGDWEEITAGLYPGLSGRALFIGDFGNNQSSSVGTRTDQKIYVVKEPTLMDTSVPVVAVLPIRYPSGNFDCEAMVYDPIAQQLVLITKDWSLAGQSKVFTRSLNPIENTLTLVGTFSLANRPFGLDRLVTGAAMGETGQVMMIRSYQTAFRWVRSSTESLASMLTRSPQGITLAYEPQGEAIALTGDQFYTVSEQQPKLIRYTPVA